LIIIPKLNEVKLTAFPHPIGSVSIIARIMAFVKQFVL